MADGRNAGGSSAPRGRVTRAARVGRVIGGQGVKLAGTGAANLLRGQDSSQAALERRHLQSAEQMMRTLGSMRGAATKIAQVVSFIDVDLMPEEFREIYQRELGKLRTHAPPMPWKTAEKVMREEWGQPLARIFSDFERDAVAAASIGQVHRATLKTGEQVAVKVQYPDVADALRADLQNVKLLLRFGRLIAPGLDVKAVAEELRERVLEELDYELESQNQRRFARAYRGHPFIHVPEVFSEFARPRVMVSEWVDGDEFDAVLQLPQAERDRFGEIIFRFAYGSIYHLHQLNADTHPGNYMLMPDGRVAFLDFGMTKRISERQIHLSLEVVSAVLADDAESLAVALDELGFLPDRDRFAAEELMEHAQMIGGWYFNGRKTKIDRKVVARTLAAMGDPRSKSFRVLRHANLPADELLGRRMETGVLAVLGKLEASANWTKICREWWFADPPATPLGREEWAFFEERGHSRRALADI